MTPEAEEDAFALGAVVTTDTSTMKPINVEDNSPKMIPMNDRDEFHSERAIDCQDEASVMESSTEIMATHAAPGGAATAKPPKPNTKITIFAEIPLMNTCKGIRLLPTQTLASLISKLQQKKIIGSHTGEALITHRPRRDPEASYQLPSLESQETLWDLGIRDQDYLVISFDLVSIVETERGEGKSVVLEEKKKKESLLDRFRNVAARKLRSSTNSAPAANGHFENSVETEQPGLLFGVPLELIADLGPPLMSVYNPAVPTFIESAFDFILKYENQTEGIFRLSGSFAAIRSYKKILDAGGCIDWQPRIDAHNAAGLIKMYLREFPEPLLTFTLFDAFSQAARCADVEFKQNAMRLLLSALPVLNYNFLKYLLAKILQLCQNEGENKMGIHNMATVFGPNLGRPVEELLDQESMLRWAIQTSTIASCLLQDYDALFDGELSASYKAIAIATYDYEAQESDELTLIADNLVLIEDVSREDVWWHGLTMNYTRERVGQGNFPSNYVRVLYSVPMTKTFVEAPIIVGEYQEYTVTDNIEEEAFAGKDHNEPYTGLTGESLEAGHELLNALSAAEATGEGCDAEEDHHSLGLQAEETIIVYNQEGKGKGKGKGFSPRDPLVALEERVADLELEIAEERKKRINLENIIPELLKNQDEVLTLLMSLKGGTTE